jgi:hypothetical protein
MSSGAEKQRPLSTALSDPATAVPSRTPSDIVEMSEPEKRRGHKDGVNVHDAEAEFNALSRRLTRQSTRRHEKDESADDVEKQETFDLLDYLRSTSGKQDNAGFAHKHVGVTFQNLRVIGAGGVKICKSYRCFLSVERALIAAVRCTNLPRCRQGILFTPVVYEQKASGQAACGSKDNSTFVRRSRTPGRNGARSRTPRRRLLIFPEDYFQSTRQLHQG